MDRDLVMTSLQSFHDKRHPIKVFEHLIGCLFMILEPFCLASTLAHFIRLMYELSLPSQ